MQRALLAAAVVMAVLACGVAVRLAWEELGSRHSAQAQETGTCPNPQLIDTFEGTGSQQSDTFDTTTDSFRITYEVNEGETTDADLAPSLLISVIDPQGRPVANASQDGAGTGETFVNEPPGTYYLDINLFGGQGATYNITVEQCEGGNPSRNPNTAPASPTPSPTSPTPSPTSPTPSPSSPTPTAPAENTILESGGPLEGPVPLTSDGSCPKEYPEQRGGACYR